MSGLYVSNKKCENLIDINMLLKYRGTDKKIIEQNENYDLIYNIMSIQTENELVYRLNDVVVLYDGVIFNSPDNSISGTTTFIIDHYLEYGPLFTQKLDGEYAVCLLDLSHDLCIFSSDIFGTKPLWYSINQGNYCIGSYFSVVQKNGFKNIKRADPNTTYCYNYRTNILTRNIIHTFSLTQYKDLYDDWINAFEQAIEKRIKPQKAIIGLSSGYDSGAIFCEAVKKNYDFTAYSFIGKENWKILSDRTDLHKESIVADYSENDSIIILKELLKYCEPYKKDHYDIYKDQSSIGIGLICKYARNNGIKIMLSGSCADAIMSHLHGDVLLIEKSVQDYSNLFPENLLHIFPWDNFFYGSRELYITQEEYVSGIYGVQPRYPFLDTKLVQEFLWLNHKIKNENYKAPLYEYFVRNHFPFINEKIGFFIR